MDNANYIFAQFTAMYGDAWTKQLPDEPDQFKIRIDAWKRAINHVKSHVIEQTVDYWVTYCSSKPPKINEFVKTLKDLPGQSKVVTTAYDIQCQYNQAQNYNEKMLDRVLSNAPVDRFVEFRMLIMKTMAHNDLMLANGVRDFKKLEWEIIDDRYQLVEEGA